jgi:hypothetical protein
MKWTISSHSALVVNDLTQAICNACADHAIKRRHGKTSEKGGHTEVIARYIGRGYAGVA